MNGYWEFVVSFVPLTVVPNVITFAATIQFLCRFACFLYYDADVGIIPSWVYYLLAISLFVYQTLDAIDGKQARRTKQSSPLGQLFDHGNDALAFTPMLVAAMGAVQYGHSWPSLIVLMCGYVVFYMLNWRARHEGMMYFGIFSVTEAQFLAIFMFIITGYFGGSLWRFRIFGYSFRSILGGFAVVAASVTSFLEWRAVSKYYEENKKKVDPGRSVELFQLFLFVTTMIVWNSLNIFEIAPKTFLIVACLIFSGMIHRLIVADVTHMKSALFANILLPLPFIFVGSILEYFFSIKLFFNLSLASTAVVYAIFGYVLICWLHYVLTVIHEICDTLNIHTFRLNPVKND